MIPYSGLVLHSASHPMYNWLMTKFYTTEGDDGYSGILGSGKLPKNHPVFEALGAVDEATAALGWARSICLSNQSRDLLRQVQHDLYELMTELSAAPEQAERFFRIQPSQVAWLEAQIDALGDQVEAPQEFILPGDSPSGASLAIARTLVRRAERRVCGLFFEAYFKNDNLMKYLNRLSSLCFVLELLENKEAGIPRATRAKSPAK